MNSDMGKRIRRLAKQTAEKSVKELVDSGLLEDRINAEDNELRDLHVREIVLTATHNALTELAVEMWTDEQLKEAVYCAIRDRKKYLSTSHWFEDFKRTKGR